MATVFFLFPMITIQIDDNGLRGRLGSTDFGTVFKPPVAKSLLLLESEMKVYPAPPSGSTYKRTGTLGRRWTTSPIKAGANEITGEVGNNTSYGPFVQSAAFQAKVHQGRWQTDEQVLSDSVPRITSFFENAASEILG